MLRSKRSISQRDPAWSKITCSEMHLSGEGILFYSSLSKTIWFLSNLFHLMKILTLLLLVCSLCTYAMWIILRGRVCNLQASSFADMCRQLSCELQNKKYHCTKYHCVLFFLYVACVSLSSTDFLQYLL